MPFKTPYPHYHEMYKEYDHRNFPGILEDMKSMGPAAAALVMGSIREYRRDGRLALAKLRVVTNPAEREDLKAAIRFRFARASYLFLAFKTR